MTDERWPTQDYLSGLSEALRIVARSLLLIRFWLGCIIVLLALILWRVW